MFSPKCTIFFITKQPTPLTLRLFSTLPSPQQWRKPYACNNVCKIDFYAVFVIICCCSGSQSGLENYCSVNQQSRDVKLWCQTVYEIASSLRKRVPIAKALTQSSGHLSSSNFYLEVFFVHLGVVELNQIITVVLQTKMAVGSIVAAILDNSIPGTKKERGIDQWLSLGKEGSSRDSGLATIHVYDPISTNLWKGKKWLRFIPFLPYYPTDEQQVEGGYYDGEAVSMDTKVWLLMSLFWLSSNWLRIVVRITRRTFLYFPRELQRCSSQLRTKARLKFLVLFIQNSLHLFVSTLCTQTRYTQYLFVTRSFVFLTFCTFLFLNPEMWYAYSIFVIFTFPALKHYKM